MVGLAVSVTLPWTAQVAWGGPEEGEESGRVTVTPGDQLSWAEPPRVRMDAEYGRRSSGTPTTSSGASGRSSGSGGGAGPTCTADRISKLAGATNHPRTADAMKQLFPDYYMGSLGGDESKAYMVSCSDGSAGWAVGDGAGTGGADGPVVVLPTPGELAERARQRMDLPLPTPGMSPKVRLDDGREATLVRENTWVWVDPGVWAERSERVQVGPVWAEVTARPRSMRFDSGMGQSVICDGPGTPYDRHSHRMHAASPDCGLRFTRSSEAMPDGETTAVYAITWSVSWRGSTGESGEGGELPDMISRASESFVVAEAQSLRER